MAQTDHVPIDEDRNEGGREEEKSYSEQSEIHSPLLSLTNGSVEKTTDSNNINQPSDDTPSNRLSLDIPSHDWLVARLAGQQKLSLDLEMYGKADTAHKSKFTSSNGQSTSIYKNERRFLPTQNSSPASYLQTPTFSNTWCKPDHRLYDDYSREVYLNDFLFKEKHFHERTGPIKHCDSYTRYNFGEHEPTKEDLQQIKMNGYAPYVEELSDGKLVKRLPKDNPLNEHYHTINHAKKARALKRPVGFDDMTQSFEEQAKSHDYRIKRLKLLEIERESLILNIEMYEEKMKEITFRNQSQTAGRHFQNAIGNPHISSELFKRLSNQDMGYATLESNRAQAIRQCCNICRKSSHFLCSGCGIVWYCSRNCQLTDWKTHSAMCSN